MYTRITLVNKRVPDIVTDACESHLKFYFSFIGASPNPISTWKMDFKS